MQRLSRRTFPRPDRPTLPAVHPLEGRVLFAAGDLDPSFSGDGLATFDYRSNDHSGDVTVQADGKVVVVGGTTDINSPAEDFLVVRFNADGSPDTSFGGGDGYIVTDFGRRDAATAVEILPDGSILVAGSSEDTNAFEYHYALARYTPSGAPDPSFGGGDGMLDFQMRGTPSDMTVQSDGKTVLAGSAEFNRFGVARVTPGGALDAGFGNGGKVVTSFNDAQTRATSVAIAPDGKIVAAGSFSRSVNRGVLARYLPDGRLDTSFAGDGKFFVEDPDPIIEGMVIQPDGKIVIVEWDFTLRRLRTGGGYDRTFGDNGIVRVPVTGSPVEFALASDLDQQADGKLIVTGSVSRQGGTGTASSSKLARLTRDGRLDTTFGDGGLVSVAGRDDSTAFNPYERFHKTDVAPDGKIVSAGVATSKGAGQFDYLYDLAVYRFQGDGPVVPPPAGGTVTVQAENGTFEGAAGSRSHAGYTGTGYLDFAADRGATASWDVEGLSGAGQYVIEFRYANGSSARTLQLRAPGVSRQVTFTSTGGWSTWRTLSVPVTLAAGDVAVSLETIGGNGPNVDSFTVRKVGTTPPPTAQQFQAEQARLVGPRVATSTVGYTGTGYVDFGDNPGQFVEWTFDHATAGQRTVTFRYANGSLTDRALQLSVNDAVVNGRLSFAPTGSWSTWREVTVQLELAAGANRVRLETIGNNGPNVDVLILQ